MGSSTDKMMSATVMSWGFFGQGVTTAWTACGLDQLVATQLTEQLLEVRQRNSLTLADGSQSDWARVLAQSQINHGSNCKSTFGGEAHDKILRLLTNSLDYSRT
jgi:hypothetical protein